MPPEGNNHSLGSDRISRDGPSLLVLSNGHGEDLIALRILEQLRTHHPRPKLEVMPLVGMGSAFAAAEQAGWLTKIGPGASLPSGGFSNQSLRGLMADLGAGLPCSAGGSGGWCAGGLSAGQRCWLLAICCPC